MPKLTRSAILPAAGIASAVATATSAVRRRTGHGSLAEAHTDPTVWRSVTVHLDSVDQATLPAPLAALADVTDVRLRQAPKDFGTEIAVRARSPLDEADERWQGESPEQAIRSALRRAKQLLETGEVLRADPQPTGKRPAGPGAVLEQVTKRAGSEGVL